MKQPIKYRHELKYFVNFHQYYVIRQRLKNLIQRDEHVGPTGEYHIRSLYFEDINNMSLAEKLGGISRRKKYRIRIYNLEDTVIHFEKKIKHNDYITKVKESISRKMADNILVGDYQELNNPGKPFSMELYYEMTHRLLRPKVIVDYVREPFIHPNGNVRITFDKNLKSGLQRTELFDRELNMVRALSANNIIMEVKFDEYLPGPIQSALQTEGLHRQAISKYVICRKFNKLNTWEDQ